MSSRLHYYFPLVKHTKDPSQTSLSNSLCKFKTSVTDQEPLLRCKEVPHLTLIMQAQKQVHSSLIVQIPFIYILTPIVPRSHISPHHHHYHPMAPSNSLNANFLSLMSPLSSPANEHKGGGLMCDSKDLTLTNTIELAFSLPSHLRV